jgi:hypothetical protein
VRSSVKKSSVSAGLALLILGGLEAVPCTAQTPDAAHALVLDGAGPWRDARWTLGVSEFTSLLTDAGYQVDTVSPADLSAAQLSPGVLLAVPSLESLPLASFKTVTAFLAAGGSLMASGGQPFRDPLYLTAAGQWLDAPSLLQTLVPAKMVLDPVTANLSQTIYVPQTVTRTTVTGPDGQSKALDFQLQMPATTQFYILTAPLTKPVFDAGQTATIVWTRGTPGQSMLFEWDETDGSRWIATVPLASQWTKQVLLPGDFLYWPSVPARAGSSFNPANASKLSFGVSSGQAAKPGPLEFAFGAIGVAAAPMFESFTAPVLETLSPSYKQFVAQMGGNSVRVPIARGRGLSATPDPDGRFRTIGVPQIPSATWYVTTSGTVTIWLPWPHLDDPQRAELVALLNTAPNRFYLLNAGPTQIVTLPGEDILLGARVLNASGSVVQASLVWSITDATDTVVAQSAVPLAVAAGALRGVPSADLGQLPSGDYTAIASLRIGDQEVDRIVSPVRVFDPTLTFQPDQRVTVANGSFATAAGGGLFLQGVNYWPRYAAALEPARFAQSWLSPPNYDPDIIEADLALLASLNFNLVSIQYTDTNGRFDFSLARSLVDFLDRCRNHGIWANIYIPAFIGGAPPAILNQGGVLGVNPNIGPILQAAFLVGNDRVFAYDLLWEPALGLHGDRIALDSAWRAWITDQYGTLANAENIWGVTAPRDAQGQISNPLDSQVQNDGAWRVMVAASRRFVDDYLSRSFGAATRLIRSASPGALISYRNGGSIMADAAAVLSNQMKYEYGTAAAHLDFISPHAYGIPVPWPAGRAEGFAAAYAAYRSGGKPVYRSEYGLSIGADGKGMATQGATCDSVMRLIAEDGSSAAAVWWMPGGWRVGERSDYGILNPDGSPRQCAMVLAQWGATFASTPPRQSSGTPVILTIDRDADARGDVGVFLRWQNDYIQAKQAGRPVVLRDDGTGTDTSTMPLMQVGNVPYSGSGPLKYANAEFAGIHVQCPNLDVTAENGAQVQVPAGSTCEITPTLINTGSATWLPTAQSKAGVVLHTNLGDLSLQNSLAYLQRNDVGPLQVTVGLSNVEITGRPTFQSIGPFGEILHFTLVVH